MDDSLLPPWWVRTKHCGGKGATREGRGERMASGGGEAEVRPGWLVCWL